MNVRFTLVADGPSDAALIPILTQLVRSDPRVNDIESQFAHPAMLPPARDGLGARAEVALSLFPANLLFVHRDAERVPFLNRRREITQALGGRASTHTIVPVVPIRMTEAWLLFDEAAIRRAAGNPNGQIQLNLPRLQDLESVPDPKASLHDALTAASELRGRALNKFNVREAAARVVELIDDFSVLSALSAFRGLKDDLVLALDAIARCGATPDLH